METSIEFLLIETAKIEKLVYNDKIQKDINFISKLDNFALNVIRIGYNFNTNKLIILEDFNFIKLLNLIKFIYMSGFKINFVHLNTIFPKIIKKINWNTFCEYYFTEEYCGNIENITFILE